MIDRGRSPAEVVSLLTSLVAESEDVRSSAKVEEFVSGLLTEDPESVDLLCAVAAFRVAERRDNEAVDLFRQVVKLAPNNVLALNNLATLLGEVSGAHDEAIRTIDRAIQIAGRRPALLDTKGTILLLQGRHADAVECLAEAVAGEAKDPRYYFHLAAARYKSGDEAGAQADLAASRELKLDKSLLTVGDLQLLEEMERLPAMTPIAK
jgi:predicted Zn-dependent protease